MNFWDFLKKNKFLYFSLILSFCLGAFITIVTISKIYVKYIAIIGGFITMVFSAAGLYYSHLKKELTIQEKKKKLIKKLDDEIEVLEEVINKEEENQDLGILKEKIKKRDRLLSSMKK